MIPLFRLISVERALEIEVRIQSTLPNGAEFCARPAQINAEIEVIMQQTRAGTDLAEIGRMLQQIRAGADLSDSGPAAMDEVA